MPELVKHEIQIDPSEMMYHHERFLSPEHTCEIVRFAGGFYGDAILTNEIIVDYRAIYPGESIWFVLRYKDQVVDLYFNLKTCRYNTDTNLVLDKPITLVFQAEYMPIEGGTK